MLQSYLPLSLSLRSFFFFAYCIFAKCHSLSPSCIHLGLMGRSNWVYSYFFRSIRFQLLLASAVGLVGKSAHAEDINSARGHFLASKLVELHLALEPKWLVPRFLPISNVSFLATCLRIKSSEEEQSRRLVYAIMQIVCNSPRLD